MLRLLAVDLARPAPPLRGGRRIACPLRGTPPPAPLSFGMHGRHCVAGHVSRASLEVLEVLGLDMKRPHCRLEALGVMFEAREPS